MQLNTKHFGAIEIDEKGIVQFDNGMPGFEQLRKVILLASDDDTSPFRWLQSIDIPELAFVVVDPFVIKPDYEIDIDEEAIKALEIEKPEDVMLLSIVVVPEDILKMTMNLKAPVVINTMKKIGAQVVLDSDKYGVRHYIMEELRKQEVCANVGTNKEEGANNSNK